MVPAQLLRAKEKKGPTIVRYGRGYGIKGGYGCKVYGKRLTK